MLLPSSPASGPPRSVRTTENSARGGRWFACGVGRTEAQQRRLRNPAPLRLLVQQRRAGARPPDHRIIAQLRLQGRRHRRRQRDRRSDSRGGLHACTATPGAVSSGRRFVLAAGGVQLRTAHELWRGELRVATGVGRERRERHHAAEARRLPPGHNRESNREDACAKVQSRGGTCLDPGGKHRAVLAVPALHQPTQGVRRGHDRAMAKRGRSGGAVGVPEPPAHASAGSSSRAPCRGTLRANRRVRLHQARCA